MCAYMYVHVYNVCMHTCLCVLVPACVCMCMHVGGSEAALEMLRKEMPNMNLASLSGCPIIFTILILLIL